jgi:hypothetical protein
MGELSVSIARFFPLAIWPEKDVGNYIYFVSKTMQEEHGSCCG